MSLRERLFGASIPESVRADVEAWRALPRPGLRRALSSAEFVVLDITVTGVDLSADLVTGVGLARVCQASLSPASLREIPVATAAREGGSFDAAALRGLLAYAAAHPVVTYHAPFIDAMLGRALPPYSVTLARETGRIDLASLLSRLHLDGGTSSLPLKAWLDRFGISSVREHDGLCDAYAMGQLFLAAMSAAENQGAQSVADLVRLAAPQDPGAA